MMQFAILIKTNNLHWMLQLFSSPSDASQPSPRHGRSKTELQDNLNADRKRIKQENAFSPSLRVGVTS